MGSLRQGEESSFCEQKEAKKLYQLIQLRGLAGQIVNQSNRSFLILFFKKEDFFPRLAPRLNRRRIADYSTRV